MATQIKLSDYKYLSSTDKSLVNKKTSKTDEENKLYSKNARINSLKVAFSDFMCHILILWFLFEINEKIIEIETNIFWTACRIKFTGIFWCIWIEIIWRCCFPPFVRLKNVTSLAWNCEEVQFVFKFFDFLDPILWICTICSFHHNYLDLPLGQNLCWHIDNIDGTTYMQNQ